MKVKLIQATQNPIDVMWVAARTCYSEKSPIDLWNDRYGAIEDGYKHTEEYNRQCIEKHWDLVKKILESGHESIAEYVNFVFAIEGIDRATSHQLVRHRIAVFCMSGDTKITTSSKRTNNKTIKELYELLPQYKKNIKVRCMDENTKEFSFKPIKSILYNGRHSIYEIQTEDGYSIRTTLSHKFLSADGWKPLSELVVGNEVYTNGNLAYKDKGWLQEHYIQNNESQEYMGLLCGVSKHTIRKYIRLHGLQKELGSWSVGVEPPNKGRTKFDYEPLKVVSEKMRGNHNAPHWTGSDNPSYRGDKITNSGGYYRTYQNYVKKGTCELCGFNGYTEFHHVDRNPKNTSQENIMELCFNCHRHQHKQRLFIAKLSKIVSIKYVGEEDTYDIEMKESPHNFVANGFVVHNSQQSQRYVEIKESFETISELFENPKTDEDEKYLLTVANKYFVGVTTDNYRMYIQCLISYLQGVKQGMKPEEARTFLPNATKTNIMMGVNLRELRHICSLRLCNRAQLPIRQLFQEIKKEVEAQDSRLASLLAPSCEVLGVCTEVKSCKRKPALKDVLEICNNSKIENAKLTCIVP